MKQSESGTKKFSTQEKVSIMKEVKLKGLKPTLQKYGLYPATYYYWRRKYESLGESGLLHTTHVKREKELDQLEKENIRLKILLADKELEIELKDKLLKKMYPASKRKL